ncbi:ammonium transporter [Cladophialophora carrionii]|uniref:Ammonium transporter n=1 Tax=Cladophialophora carrionii TaxID=86049 RepID=A0A1C1CFH8_9EURO|nr:ammonium transporter [Cladophialophora carrionii]
MMDLMFFTKSAVIGAIQRIITGLVDNTPAVGFVAGWGAIIIGLCWGIIPWISTNILGKQKCFLEPSGNIVGDSQTHLVGGIVGGFLTGLFATNEGVVAFAPTPVGGAIDENGRQLWVQIVGFRFIISWETVLDQRDLPVHPLFHGELAYAFFDDGRHDSDAHYGKSSRDSEKRAGVLRALMLQETSAANIQW